MAFVQTQKSIAAPGATTIAQAFDSPVTAGSVLVVGVSWDFSAAQTFNPVITDTLGNLWTQVGETSSDFTSTQRLAHYIALSPAGGADTVTATFLGSESSRKIVVAEYSGRSTAPLGEFIRNQMATSITGADGAVTASMTPAVAGCDLVGILNPTQAPTSVAAGTGFTERAETTDSQLQLEDLTQGAAGAQAGKWTVGAAGRYHAVELALRPAGAPGIAYVGRTVAAANNPTSASWTLPAAWQAGDVAVFWWYTLTNTKTLTPPGTVTSKREVNAVGFGHIFIGYRILVTGDTTFAWTSSTVANSSTVYGVTVFRNVSQYGDPFEAESGAPAQFSNTVTPDPPAVTTISPNACVVTVVGINNDSGGDQANRVQFTPPTGYTEGGFGQDIAGTDASAGVAWKIDPTIGSEDPGTWGRASGAATDDGYVWTGALRPSQSLIYRPQPAIRL